MPVQMKTPGVYIVEKNAFPPSVVAVETAVPAFVGYTEWAEFKGKPLANVPFKVTSMSEFETAFGGPPKPRFRIEGPKDADYKPVQIELLPPPSSYSVLLNAPAAKDEKLTDAELAAITERRGKVSVDPADTTTLDGLKALEGLKVGTPLTEEQSKALDLLRTLPLTSLPATTAPKTLNAAQQETLAKVPAASTGKLADGEFKAISAALGVATIDAAQKTLLAAMTVGEIFHDDQKTALTALQEAVTSTPKDTSGTAPSRSHDLKIGQYFYQVVRDDALIRQYQLWYAMRMFFDNGGGPCWIVSVGKYGAEIGLEELKDGIEALKDELEPTMLVIPDATKLPDVGTCISLQQAMLKHCGDEMKNRFAILDIYDGDQAQQPDDPVAKFRDLLGVNNLNFGAAYYPWLNTVVVQERDITFRNFLDKGNLPASVDRLLIALTPQETDGLWFWDKIDVPRLEDSSKKQSIRTFLQADLPVPSERLAVEQQQATIDQINGLLVETVPAFKLIRAEAVRQLNVLAPAGAMAGLYTFVDNNRGVWKAPANVSVNNAVSPCVPISNYLQQDLNVTPMGKSINAIRAFIGEGVLVWGARTLDGNSQDWRYINVRRTMIFLEESCRLAAKRMVFEPNVSGTWVTIKAMIENFLHSVWRQGGLAGAVPEDAYSVHVGLGDTMTADDILDGILRVTVLVAISRPAEFIEITFQQQLQKS